MAVKVVWVDSWKDYPETSRQASNLGVAHGGKVYAIKERTPASVVEHEKYHIEKGQDRKVTRKAEVDVRQELEAHLHAYRKTGSPKHILASLRAIAVRMVEWYRKDWDEVVGIIKDEMDKLDTPKGWRSDLHKLDLEIKEGWIDSD